jgi:hypothetical protein
MYLLYVDESGTPVIGEGPPHFLLLGLAVPVWLWSQYSQQITALKAKYRLENREIHAGWMVRRYVEQEKIPDFENLNDQDRIEAVEKERRLAFRIAAASKPDRVVKNLAKNFKKTSPFIHLTHRERLQAIENVCGLVEGWNEARIFCDAIRKEDYRQDHPPFQEAFTQVVSRFEAFLQNYGRFRRKKYRGLIIQDNNQTEASRLTAMMRGFHFRGTRWRSIDSIVETPLFVDSELTEMIQVADVCAYVTRRFFDNSEDELFSKIYGRFDRARDVVVGLRHFTGPTRCECRVCLDHRR